MQHEQQSDVDFQRLRVEWEQQQWWKEWERETAAANASESALVVIEKRSGMSAPVVPHHVLKQQ